MSSLAINADTVTVTDQDRRAVVAREVRIAKSPWSRFLGLMGRRSLREGEGLLLIPGGSIHTLFMRFPIDVFFLDKEWRVQKVARNVKPFRLAFARRGVRAVLEVPAGTAAAIGAEQGDTLLISV
ncbi:MAG TPA: DUF192 domain-containing protein [Dehalococcoidia bacterium]|nr:DUF192 domain-containing protein [Dehalococcoidia bacterium]